MNKAADSIMSYQTLLERLYRQQDADAAERKLIYPVLSRIFNPFVFDKMVTPDRISRPADNPPLQLYDPNT